MQTAMVLPIVDDSLATPRASYATSTVKAVTLSADLASAEWGVNIAPSTPQVGCAFCSPLPEIQAVLCQLPSVVQRKANFIHESKNMHA